ncbi:MAG: NAD(P)-dependent oxidoreductase [Candidatus Paceibacterota bacterium]|jgi:D-lactate dehydrogenase
MNIHFFGVHEWEKSYLEGRAHELFDATELQFSAERLSEDTAPAASDAECVSIFVDSKMTKAVIDRFPRLQLIATRSTGYDMVDMEYAKAKGITVANVPSYGEHTVAEFTFALMLALSRKLYDCIIRTKELGRFDYEGLTGFDLREKTLGVIGTGRIGVQVIALAKAFGMKVVAHDVFLKPELAASLGFTYVPLDELLATSDIVTLHVPASPNGGYLVGTDELQKMKSTAYLINTSRGSLVDTQALVAALGGGKLAGAALDVLEDEVSLTKEGLMQHPLHAFPNVIITPHTAFNTKEAIERILETALQNINEFKKGTPQNVVTA